MSGWHALGTATVSDLRLKADFRKKYMLISKLRAVALPESTQLPNISADSRL
jgi:hypothetical protein